MLPLGTFRQVLSHFRYAVMLIHDRDPLFTEAVRGLLRDSGVKPLRPSRHCRDG